MKAKFANSELSQMMKVATQCLDTKGITDKCNIRVTSSHDALTIRATNGTMYAEVSTALIGGDDENFCVDGKMFSKVISGCSGDVTIETDDKACIIRGSGRTRLPIVPANIPDMDDVDGIKVTVSFDDFRKCYDAVSYAVSVEQTRLILTGVLLNVSGGEMTMAALDGFQLAVDSVPCDGDDCKAVVPNSFMKLMISAFNPGETVTLTIGQNRIMAESVWNRISSGLLTGEFVDYKKIIPDSFSTEVLVNKEQIRSALKSGSIVNEKSNIVKMNVSETSIKLSSNGEKAEFDAEIECSTQGNTLEIGFNQQYLINAMNAVNNDEAVIHMNTRVSPIIIRGKGSNGTHLLLPVRIM